jgi:hypothetical protein
MDSQRSVESHSKMLRNWHLAVLRFAVTKENTDRLGLFAVAKEIDALGRSHEDKPSFGFFRKTSSELCAAILDRNEAADAILRQYLAQIDDVRLKRAFAGALELELPGTATEKRRSKAAPSSWRGLRSRNNIRA